MPNGECELDCGHLGLDEDVDWESGALFCTCPYGYRFEEYTEDDLETLEDDMYEQYYDGCDHPMYGDDYEGCLEMVAWLFMDDDEGDWLVVE
jgi:hypothetical protein